MKTLFLFAGAIFFFSKLLMAQNPLETGNVPISLSSGGGQYTSLFANLMNKRTKVEHARIGSPYFFDYWTTGTVDIDGRTYILEKVKLDLLENALEVFYEGESKYIDAVNFTRFSLYDQEKGKQVYFTNANLYKVNDKRLSAGIMKATQVGEYNILTHLKAKLLHPSQAKIINGVDPRPRVVQETFLYLEHKGVVYPLKNKKHLETIFRKKQGKLKSYLKDHKINIKKEEDLVNLLIYLQQ